MTMLNACPEAEFWAFEVARSWITESMQGNVKKQAGAELCQAKESYAKNAIHLGNLNDVDSMRKIRVLKNKKKTKGWI